MYETPSWRLELWPLPSTPYKHLYLWSDYCTKGVRWFNYVILITYFSYCKIEFNQPSCWLYFVSNLLVFQQLVTLYLGGILVRVVSEIVWGNAQECTRKNKDSRLDLAGDSRLQAANSYSRARSWSVTPAGALQDKIGQLAVQLPRGWNSRLSQATRQPCFEKTWLFTFHSHPNINTPFTHERKIASREKFERETLEKNKIDSSKIFIKILFKFLNSLPLYC